MTKKIIIFSIIIYLISLVTYTIFEDTLSPILFDGKRTLNEIATGTFVGVFGITLFSILVSHFLSLNSRKEKNRLLKTLDEKDVQYEAIYQDHELLKNKYASFMDSPEISEEIKEEFKKGNVEKVEQYLLNEIEKDKLNEIKRHIILGDIYFMDFQYPKAIASYQRALSGEKNMITDLLKINIYNSIGRCYFQDGFYSEAIEFQKKSLFFKTKVEQHNSESIIQSYVNIAIVYNYMGVYKESIRYYKEALKLYSNHSIDNKELKSDIYNNLGLVLYELERYEDAIKNYSQALELRESLDSSELDKATSYNCLGASYNCLEQYNEAKDCLEKALDIRIKRLGETHLLVSIVYNNLGLLYMNTYDYSKAKECFDKALSIKKSKLRSDHPSLATIYNNISQICMKEKEYKLSINYLEEALRILILNYGDTHKNVVYTYSNIACLYFDDGDYDKSLKYHNLALKKGKKLFGKKDERLEIFKDAIQMTKKFKMMKVINDSNKN